MPLLQSPPGPTAIVDGRQVLYFVGTAYHALQSHPEVLAAAKAALEELGLGSGTSRGRFGTTAPLLRVEAAATALFGTEGALHLPSGYQAAAALVGAVARNYDWIIHDQYAHYALLDAAAATGLPRAAFTHADPAAMEHALSPGLRALVLTDGLFAIRGTVAPLADYWRIVSARPGCALLVDDAHGMGVLGAQGRGSLEAAGLWDEHINAGPAARLLVCGTLSKALGGYGGIIPCGREMREHLQRTSRLFNGASPVPPAIAAGSAAALEVFTRERGRLLGDLRARAALLRQLLRQAGLPCADSPSPIVWLELGPAEHMQAIQRRLLAEGIAIDYVPRYSGTGPEGGLRIAVCSAHTPEMIQRLALALAQAAR